jgi:hypothetical protein
MVPPPFIVMFAPWRRKKDVEFWYPRKIESEKGGFGEREMVSSGFLWGEYEKRKGREENILGLQ